MSSNLGKQNRNAGSWSFTPTFFKHGPTPKKGKIQDGCIAEIFICVEFNQCEKFQDFTIKVHNLLPIGTIAAGQDDGLAMFRILKDFRHCG